eukprot:454972-Hanusia_phi.AAC.3
MHRPIRAVTESESLGSARSLGARGRGGTVRSARAQSSHTRRASAQPRRGAGPGRVRRSDGPGRPPLGCRPGPRRVPLRKELAEKPKHIIMENPIQSVTGRNAFGETC